MKCSILSSSLIDHLLGLFNPSLAIMHIINSSSSSSSKRCSKNFERFITNDIVCLLCWLKVTYTWFSEIYVTNLSTAQHRTAPCCASVNSTSHGAPLGDYLLHRTTPRRAASVNRAQRTPIVYEWYWDTHIQVYGLWYSHCKPFLYIYFHI